MTQKEIPAKKYKQSSNIADLPIFIGFVQADQESFIEVVAEALLDLQFLKLPNELAADHVDLKDLLGADDGISRLIYEDRK